MRFISVDVGNTNPHVGIFEKDTLQTVLKLEDFKYNVSDRFLISNVTNKILPFKSEIDLKSKRSPTHFFEMPIHYALSLGMDRMVCAYRAFQNNQCKVQLINAGTFMTIDCISSNGFLGGYIFPGTKTFLSAYSKGEQLVNIHFDFQNNEELKKLPENTEEAINRASNIYLKSVIEKITTQNAPDKIILTGGDMEIIKKIIDELNLKVELELDPHYVHQSLHQIFHRHLKDR
jgi:type III pantothenate kinase